MDLDTITMIVSLENEIKATFHKYTCYVHDMLRNHNPELKENNA